MLGLNDWGKLAVKFAQYTASPPGGVWALELVLNTASLPGGSGQWSSRSFCNALLLGLGAMGCAPLAMHCVTA